MPTDILSVKHPDFKLLVDCSNYDRIRCKAISHLKDEDKLLTPYTWSEDVENISVCSKELTKEDNRAYAVFYENATYPLWFDFGEEEPEYVYLDTPLEKVKENFQQRGNIFFGFLNYGNEIGKSDITIRYKLKNKLERQFKLGFYVLSTKLDYFNDWNIIVRDIEREYQMLSLAFLQRTYHSFDHSAQGETPDIIWWNLFDEYQQRFIRAVKRIIERPHRRLRLEEKLVRVDKLKRLTPAIERELEQYRPVATHLYRTQEKVLSHDTPENRFLKYALLKINGRFTRLKKQILSLRECSSVYKESIKETEHALKQLCHHPFFRNVGAFKGFSQESMVLQRATGYSEVYRTWLILRSSYSLQEGMHNLQTKDIATLYEIWCFIAVKNIVEDYLKQKAPQLITDNRSRMELNRLFTYNLSKGEHSRVIFKEGDVELAELIYNPKSDDKETIQKESGSWDEHVVSKTVSQKPDIVLRLSKTDYQSGIKLTYLFDAKYCIDSSEKVKMGDDTISYVERPPEYAINQMHRYRDALLFSSKKGQDEVLQKEVIGGYILFPGRGDNAAFERSKLLQSQSSVNIGAFPLRPDSSDIENISEVLLRKFIDRILNGEALQILKLSIPQKGLEYKVVDDMSVFVGVVTEKLKEYPKFIADEAEMYYTGKTFPSTYNIMSFKYFAPYFAGEGIRGYYEITGIRSATKAEILQNDDTDDSMRFLFQLGAYHKLSGQHYIPVLYKDTYAKVSLSKLILPL